MLMPFDLAVIGVFTVLVMLCSPWGEQAATWLQESPSAGNVLWVWIA